MSGFFIDPYKFGPMPVPDPYWSYTNLLLHSDAVVGTNQIQDYSAAGVNATIGSGGSISTAQSKWGGASLYCDGVSSSTPASTSTTNPSIQRFDNNVPSTWEMWFKEEDASSGGALLGIRDTTLHGVILGVNALHAYINAAWHLNYLTWARPTVGEWHHIAWMTTGYLPVNNMYIFIDGVLVASSSFSSIETMITVPLVIGRSGVGTPNAVLKGWIDDIRFTRGIARYPTSGFTPPTGPFANSNA